MVLELLGTVLWYYRNNPANVKRIVDSIHPLSSIDVAKYHRYLQRIQSSCLPGRRSRPFTEARNQINAAVCATRRLPRRLR